MVCSFFCLNGFFFFFERFVKFGAKESFCSLIKRIQLFGILNWVSIFKKSQIRNMVHWFKFYFKHSVETFYFLVIWLVTKIGLSFGKLFFQLYCRWKFAMYIHWSKTRIEGLGKKDDILFHLLFFLPAYVWTFLFLEIIFQNCIRSLS